MATVAELTGPYGTFLLNPPSPATPGVCRVCLTFTDGYPTCYRCGFQAEFADAVLPISYSVHFGQLHTNLRAYKRAPPQVARPLQMQLAAVIWRFLERHETCLARAAGAERFDLVTTVPSGLADRDEAHRLRWIVSTVVEPTRDRFERLLMRSGTSVPERSVDPLKYSPMRDLSGESVLLIDDTWTTGANAQSASGALKTTGAGPVGVLVLGRHIHEDYQNNAERLRAVPRPFDWNACALH